MTSAAVSSLFPQFLVEEGDCTTTTTGGGSGSGALLLDDEDLGFLSSTPTVATTLSSTGFHDDLLSYLLDQPDSFSSPLDPPPSSSSSLTSSPTSSPCTYVPITSHSPSPSISSPSPPPTLLPVAPPAIALDRTKIKKERTDSLSPDEERQLKRQRRLIKNRESAQLSRLRKKAYIDDLEKKVTTLTQENDILTKKINILVENNKQLTEQVAHLQNMLKTPSSKKQSTATANNNNNKKLQAAGICMLMLLFSFGLFLNMKSTDNALTVGEPIRVGGRVLNSIEDDKILPNLPPSLPDTNTGAHLQPVIHQQPVPRKASPKKKRVIKVQNNDESNLKVEVKGETGLVLQNQVMPVKVPDHQQIHHITRGSRDTNYLYCSEPQLLLTPEGIEIPNISFLLPGNLSSTFHHIPSDLSEQTIMEINCQILGVRFYPIRNDTVN